MANLKTLTKFLQTNVCQFYSAKELIIRTDSIGFCQNFYVWTFWVPGSLEFRNYFQKIHKFVLKLSEFFLVLLPLDFICPQNDNIKGSSENRGIF